MYNTDQQASEMAKMFGAWLETSRQFWQDTVSDSGKNNSHNFSFPFTAHEEKIKAYHFSFIKLIFTPQNIR